MSGRSIGKEVIELVSVGSTNKEAAELLAMSQAAHGTVILAHEQTDGRGQRGRSWSSGAGLDLTFSVVLLPKRLKATDQFALAKVAALAVHEVVQAHVRNETRIKWPNDVLVDRRKIAGILIKNEVVGGLVQSVIVGVGLNVNSKELDEAYLPTSLRLETGKEHDRMALLQELLDALERRWKQWQGGVPGIAEDYSALLWAKGRWTPFELNGTRITARPVDVDADGRLIVETEDGKVAAYGLERLRFAGR
ncbi:MAG: biotin--[acetyl-CoA-carboxylase] ligase [Flavobacteriales bacterium]